MIKFTQGNLLEADVEAVVNTVNTVGVMGKGIALMFKERFPRNFDAYARACDEGKVRIGEMYVTANEEFFGPRWIINFPTKTHWRAQTKIEWVRHGLEHLVQTIVEKNIQSIAIPPLGCGNGGLHWSVVGPLIASALKDVESVNAIIYEPTPRYQDVSKHAGVENLTPARALVAEMVRRYCLLGIDCSILEVQKLGWFIERGVRRFNVTDPLNFKFQANKFGPYSHKLTKLLDSIDGSYLRCEKRLADADTFDLIWFNEAKHDQVQSYLNSGEGREFSHVLEWAASTIDGFESPLGMELIATIDWMLQNDKIEPTINGVMEGLKRWPGGEKAGQRKLKIFDHRLVAIALKKLESTNSLPT